MTEKKNELKDIWRIFEQCQHGNPAALNDLFVSEVCNNSRFDVGLKHNCLSAILYNTRERYNSASVSIKNNHKKYFPGEYDISDLNEMMYLILTELFIGELDKGKCATIGSETSNIPLTDGEALLKNISFFLDKQLNSRGKRAYKDIGYTCNDDTDNEELSLMDVHSARKWYGDKGKTARKWIYADILRLFEKDIGTVYDLYNADSTAIRATIKTVLECKDSFVDDEFLSQEEFCEMVERYTGKHIQRNNLPQCFTIIKQRIMDYLMFSLNYDIGSGGLFTQRESKLYFRMFGRQQIELYKLCVDFKRIGCKKFIRNIKKYDHIILPVIEKKSGKLKYDMVNLLQGQRDVLNEPPGKIAKEILAVLLSYFKENEKKKIQGELQGYMFNDRFSAGKAKYWNIDLDENEMKIKLWARASVKYPVKITINRKSLLVYDGFRNYYVCDTQKRIAYCLPKEQRKVIKAGSQKKNLKNIA